MQSEQACLVAFWSKYINIPSYTESYMREHTSQKINSSFHRRFVTVIFSFSQNNIFKWSKNVTIICNIHIRYAFNIKYRSYRIYFAVDLCNHISHNKINQTRHKIDKNLQAESPNFYDVSSLIYLIILNL